MNVFTIDTLGTTKNLKDSGFSESQAKAITESVREAQQQNLDVLATKGDLENGLENLEVCLNGFPLPDLGSRTSFAGMTFLRLFSLHCHSGRSEAQTRNPGVLLQSWTSSNIWF